MMNEISSTQIIELLNEYNITYHFTWNQEVAISNYCPLNNLKENSITWVRQASDTPVTELNRLQNVLLIAELGAEIPGAQFPVIFAENAHRSYFRIIQEFFKDEDPENRQARIEDSAIVETENIGQDVYIGHRSFIGKEVKIADHVQILHNVVIQGKVEIGTYSVIESGAMIGNCGYGHYNDEAGNPVCVPHLGGVRIGEHVRIGANSTIARGCLADTVIEDYVKVDNLCHIAHNDYIKKGAMIVAGTVISGSTTVGEHAWVAPGSVLNNAIHIGNESFLGLGSVALRDVPDNMAVAGNPARVLKQK